MQVTGPKGKLTVPIPPGVRISRARRRADTSCATADEHAALHGLTRALVANAVQGVSTGFVRNSRSSASAIAPTSRARSPRSRSGYSHPIEVLLPEGVDLKIDKQTQLELSGYDRQLVGQVAANIRGAAQARSVQEQGHPLQGRSVAQEGRQDRRGAKCKMITQRSTRTRSARRIHKRIRRKVQGTEERPRLAVFRSVAHIYVQVIDDRKGRRWWRRPRSRRRPKAKRRQCRRRPRRSAKLIAERAKEKGIKQVVFDRGGYQYHGRVKALADAAREAGLEF